MDLDVTWGCPLVVHYWADLQLVHGFHCYDNAKCQQVLVLALWWLPYFPCTLRARTAHQKDNLREVQCNSLDS